MAGGALRGREVGEREMKFVVNGTLHPGKSREDLIAHAKDRSISDEAWDLVRTGVITEHGYKIGQRPGFFLVIEGDSEEAVHSTVSALPFLRDGWFDIEVDPITRFLSDVR
jgi:hypothetical protein